MTDSTGAFQSTTGSNTYPTLPAGQTDLRVATYDCGVAIPNVPFIFTSQVVQGTNGHAHVGGTVLPPPNAIADLPGYVAGTTGPDGRSAPMHVTAGRFGGAFDIAIHADDIVVPGFSSTSHGVFTVGFPWLQNLTFIPEDLDLGATGAKPYHPLGTNHYGVPELFELIRWAPTVFRTHVRDDAKILTVNDMSLQLGGYFDLNGAWNPSGSHVTHRLGFDVDIDRSYTDFYGVKHPMTVKEIAWFKEAIVAGKFGRVLEEPSIHLRLNEDIIDKYLGGQP